LNLDRERTGIGLVCLAVFVLAGHSIGAIRIAGTSQRIMTETLGADLRARAFGIFAAGQQAETVHTFFSLKAVAAEAAFGRNFVGVAAYAAIAELLRAAIAVVTTKGTALGIDANLAFRTITVVQTLRLWFFTIDTNEVLTDPVRRAIGVAGA